MQSLAERSPSMGGRWLGCMKPACMVLARMVLACMVLGTTVLACTEAVAADGPLLVEVEQGDGSVTKGRLERIDASGVGMVDTAGGVGGVLSLPSERVRSVRKTPVAVDMPHAVVLTLVDGSTLTGDDFTWNASGAVIGDGKQPAVLMRPEGRVEVPASRVRSIAWRKEGAAAAAASPWQAGIPEGTESDLVVVGTDENHEFVECAITGVSADAVTVVLDEETIPVKRSKVIGLHWLRAAPTPEVTPVGRVLVAVTGGGLQASRVEWSGDGLVIDGEIRLPSSMLAGVDYAAGRIVSLASLAPEKVEVEPWFGGLVLGDQGRTAGLASFFAPRMIESRAGPEQGAPLPAVAAKPLVAGTSTPGIIMRPRTVAVWRVPPESRRFRARVAAAAGPQTVDAAVVIVSADDRELFRRQIDASSGVVGEGIGGGAEQPEASVVAGIPIDVDLTSARRLTVTVDFLPGSGIGGAVRFINPAIER